jgi:hypothetical protein
LNNNTAGVREREGANRTREAGHLEEIQGVVANTLNLFRNGAACRVSSFSLVGFIVWLGLSRCVMITVFSSALFAARQHNPRDDADQD